MNTNQINRIRAEAAASLCNMTAEAWWAAKDTARAAKERGRTKHRRPESTLADPVEGQMGLFSDPEGAEPAEGTELHGFHDGDQVRERPTGRTGNICLFEANAADQAAGCAEVEGYVCWHDGAIESELDSVLATLLERI
jgi:hypothetical protein